MSKEKHQLEELCQDIIGKVCDNIRKEVEAPGQDKEQNKKDCSSSDAGNPADKKLRFCWIYWAIGFIYLSYCALIGVILDWVLHLDHGPCQTFNISRNTCVILVVIMLLATIVLCFSSISLSRLRKQYIEEQEAYARKEVKPKKQSGDKPLLQCVEDKMRDLVVNQVLDEAEKVFK